jgi:Xaa-Pro aminopeptidase
VVLTAQQSYQTLRDLLLASNEIKILAFGTDTTLYKNFIDLQASLNAKIKLLPIENPVKRLRMIKDGDEIKALRASAKLGSEGYDYVASLIKDGVSETALALELEIFWKRAGAKGAAFDPIIAFGANSSMPHYRAGEAILKRGDHVLIDIGVDYKNYHSDMTRVVFPKEPPSEIKHIYQIVKAAQKKALELCRPGTLIGDLDNAARNYIASEGFGEQFSHNLGHGIGLETHEMPNLRNTPANSAIRLQPGMAITIEPGIYLSGLGGIRLEDTVVITESGHENLTNRAC